MAIGIDFAIVLVILLMAYAVSSEGLWGATLMFFNVLFAGLIAFNFYEPLAALLAENVDFLASYADMLCLMLLFLISLSLLRLATSTIARSRVRFAAPIDLIGRLLGGLATGAVAMAIIVLAFDTAPVHKKVFGVIDYKEKPPFGRGIDHHWLGFFQRTTGQVFASYSGNEDDETYGRAQVFDRRGDWLLRYQRARKFGTGPLPDEPEAAQE